MACKLRAEACMQWPAVAYKRCTVACRGLCAVAYSGVQWLVNGVQWRAVLSVQ